MNNNERLYEAIEESARTKKPIRLDMQEGMLNGENEEDDIERRFFL